jgi:Phosphoglycerate dehydrogenase and related dehydrogenases
MSLAEPTPFRERPPPDTVSEERILFALSDRERSLFFADARPELAAGRVAWSRVDPEALDDSGWAAALRAHRPTVLVTAWSAKPVPDDWIDSDDFSLRYVCHVTGSLKKIMSERLYARGVRATNWGTSINHTVAEHAMLLVLALLRGVPGWRDSIVTGGWTLDHVRRLRTRSLRGARVGLHGFGAIARDIVPLLAPFRPAVVSAWSRGVPPDFIACHGVRPAPSLEALFAEHDILIGCESLTPENRGSVDARILALLADDAVFVNVGRGQIVDETALLAEAASGRLRLGLDVFHREPLPADSPLLAAHGILLSPHIAGPTWDTYRVCGDHALTNLRDYLDGKPLDGEVSADLFARMT